MTRPRDERGRFVSVKPVLHRQPDWTGAFPCDGEDELRAIRDADTAEWLQATAPQPIDHGPRIELRTLALAVLFLAIIVAAAFMGLAWLSGGGAGQ